MTQITNDHVEWAVVDRLRLMLKEPPHKTFNVTQTFALFTSVLCWVMQRIRVRPHELVSRDDKIAHRLLKTLSESDIANDPWRIHTVSTPRIETIGSISVFVPAPKNFNGHTVDRFLINLRDTIAHGDARNVSPFNVSINSARLLAGFTFACAEFEGSGRNRTKVWEGEITLLEKELRRIGCQLAKIYCDALRRSESHRRDSHFGHDAASIREPAA